MKRVLAGVVTVTVLAVGGIAAAGAVSTGSTPKHAAHPRDRGTAGRLHHGLRRTHHRFHTRRTLEAAAATIGINSDALRVAMGHGQSIATVAKAHHVDPAKVAAAMTSAAQRNFDAAAKTRRRNPRYRKMLPGIMRKIVNHTPGSHRAARHTKRTTAA